jgi:hypothetical protein
VVQSANATFKLPLPRTGKVPWLTALLAAAIWGACFFSPSVWTISGIGEADKLFLDLRNILAAGEALQHGIDPYVKSPLDPYNRPHGYTAWWLVVGSFGLTLADTLWLGTLLIGVTLVAAVLITRPADWRHGGVLLLVLASPPVLLAINRANHDLVVFALMCAALACLRVDRAPLRALGVVLLAVAAVLKYFPLAAGIILLDARTRRELLGWCLLYGLVLLLAWPSLAPGLRVAVSHKPAPSWLYAFGAEVVFRDFNIAAPKGWLLAGLLVATASATWWVIRGGKIPALVGAAREQEREFACGAVMIVGCFLHSTSYIYKLVFALWLLPWLWRATQAEKEKRWWRITFGLLLAVFWFEGGMAVVINLLGYASVLTPARGMKALEVTLVVSQLLTFALATCLGWHLLLYTIGQVTRLRLPVPRSAH